MRKFAVEILPTMAYIHIIIIIFSLFLFGCTNTQNNSSEIEVESDSIVVEPENIITSSQDTLSSEVQRKPERIVRIVPNFIIAKREREDFNDYTPRTRYHIRIPKQYDKSELDAIADSLLDKEREEHHISEIWVNYYLPKAKLDFTGTYALSIRLHSERSTNIHQKQTHKKTGYNPPKPRDLTDATLRQRQLWGAFDDGQIAGYEVGYKDGKKKRTVYYSFNSSISTFDEWIEQSYKQGYEIGYIQGFDDAGGDR